VHRGVFYFLNRFKVFIKYPRVFEDNPPPFGGEDKIPPYWGKIFAKKIFGIFPKKMHPPLSICRWYVYTTRVVNNNNRIEERKK